MYDDYIKMSPRVKEALDHNLPVVALESTIISHGMPYPENYETALKAEQVVLDNGAIPATIAIIDGKIIIGLSHEEIECLAKIGPKAVKVSRRDIPVIVASKQNGATTVAATMFLASLAKIKVFATGGIGGVHRGWQTSMDVSADLDELAQTNVAVVCAGIKSILDLGLTLEYLETKGVPVIGYNCDYLPAFYTTKSDYKVNYNLCKPLDIAIMLNVKWQLGLNGGVVIANPIKEKYSLDKNKIDEVINQAIDEMNKLKITGKETTPYLLKRISELTGGESLASNIQLVLSNCELASKIAIEYSRIDRGGKS
jgi:pseudouridine-5'-phosphate glycosidase